MTCSMRPWLLAMCVAAGCSGTNPTQVLTGQVTTSGAVAVRAVSDGAVVTAARVRSDGSFTLALPAGSTYRLELLTSSGVKQVLGSGLTALEFQVCHPTQPFDCGGMGGDTGGGGGNGTGGGCDPNTDPNCKCYDSNGTMVCPPPPPPPCDPNTDPTCPCDPNGTTTCPPPCDPNSDPNCPPPPPPWCDPANDPTCPCKVDSNGQVICPPPPCDPNTDPTCPPPCDPSTDPTCPPPPCIDPNDPSTCKDPCMIDPASCGCPGTNGQTDDNGNGCWPPPAPPQCDSSGKCDPDGVVPQHPPGDFGCQESSGT